MFFFLLQLYQLVKLLEYLFRVLLWFSRHCVDLFSFLIVQLLYLHNLDWPTGGIDRSMIALTCWSASRIKKCLSWIRRLGGFGSNKVSCLT